MLTFAEALPDATFFQESSSIDDRVVDNASSMFSFPFYVFFMLIYTTSIPFIMLRSLRRTGIGEQQANGKVSSKTRKAREFMMATV